jgi:hypothetical protein
VISRVRETYFTQFSHAYGGKIHMDFTSHAGEVDAFYYFVSLVANRKGVN